MAHANIGKTHPAAYQAMMELNNQAAHAAAAAGLDAKLIELVKIRASQLNGCAFCLKLHVGDAIKHGETWDRLAVIAGWWESHYFTPEEQAALQIAERVTLISDHGHIPDRGVDEDRLTDRQAAAVTWLTIVINAWNRIAITSHYPVAPTA
ncbi:alkyl hydroperoxide reductase AhpD [Microlunatus endophyticus]|uniref:Alkyl hydroperoxide reductase AhpD n=1 Tax=Microlunatus endophyticus TaxID=1716077 RepID=A0A917SGC5_9ACTN|nr:carboxymuconolactone decarboxylase family protein [Microlunatus endophyticus]GGL80760.1 alkyl hydroperoxide reductase AhpD [Microlunatus endophyticus]